MMVTPETRERKRGYDQKYRTLHRERENERKRLWRAEHPNRRARPRREPPPPIPQPFTGDAIFERARSICGPRPYFDRFARWEDLMSTVVVALVEGVDPVDARRRFLAAERRFEIMHAPIFPNVDFDTDGRVVRVGTRESFD